VPASPTPPGPPPSGCPGGSLAACIDLCPSDPPAAFEACVTDCEKRCTNEVVTVFSAGEGGYRDILNPSMVQLSTGKLLVFSEARGGNGGDGSAIDVAYKFSTDEGKTWSALRSIVINNVTKPSSTLGNNVAFVVNETTASGGERVVLVFCANNTFVWQIHSDDGGDNWTSPRDITPQVKGDSEGWIATGPANGVVLASGRILVPVNTNVAKGRIHIDYQLVPGSEGRNRQCPMASLKVGVRGAPPSTLPELHSPSGRKQVVDPCTHLDLGSLFKLQQVIHSYTIQSYTIHSYTIHSYTIHSYTMHSYTHTLIHSYTHTLIHSYTHTLIHYSAPTCSSVTTGVPVGSARSHCRL
jgi:hypothetical protein